MTIPLPDMTGPAQPPSDDLAKYMALVFLTMAAETALFFFWAFAFAPQPWY